MLVSVFTAPKYFVNKRPVGTLLCGRVCEKQIYSEAEIFLQSHLSLTKSENLRIVVPRLTNRASSIHRVKAEGLREEYRFTYYQFVCVLILLL